MTAQASERVAYRNEEYPLVGCPLAAYLEQRKDIVFADYSTAHWRG